MTTAGDAAPVRSRSNWIVRLHKDTIDGGTRASTPRGDSTVALAGNVVAHRGQAGTNFGAVSIHRPSSGHRLELSAEAFELACELRDLPETNNTRPATDLDHVVHILCSRFEEPEAIEDFLEATRGLIDDYIIGREAWFEVLAHPVDREGGVSSDPFVDDVFVGRYPTLESWHALHELAPWKRAIEALEAEATTMFHLVVAPTINRVASYR